MKVDKGILYWFRLLANANAEVDNLQQELIKKTTENAQQQDEIVRLSYEVRVQLKFECVIKLFGIRCEKFVEG